MIEADNTGSTILPEAGKKNAKGSSLKYNMNSYAAVEIAGASADDTEPMEDTCGSRYVMSEQNVFRACWSMTIFVTLIYISTVWLYRFAFLTFHISSESEIVPIGEDATGWKVVDIIADVIFWIDLLVNFFFSFKTNRGVEVRSLAKISQRYLGGLFWVNFIACIPDLIGKLLVWLIGGMSNQNPRTVGQVAKLGRLQRISRLTRLIRLTRLLKLLSMFAGNEMMKWFESLRGVRIINFLFGLMFSVHLLASGWYLCAGLHTNIENTWVYRRGLQGVKPEEQWLHSMYFVLTVFTTVGFGDMSAGTEFEIIYVAFVMVVGTVVHSIIISEVIQAVTSTDQLQQFTDKQLNLIEAFCDHTQLPWETQRAMKDEMKFRAKELATSYNFNKDEMKKLITGKELPRWLIGSLPDRMWRGKLLKNQFLSSTTLYRPPRLPCLLAIHLHQSDFSHGEIVFQMNDFAFNIFLVLHGTFAHIAQPTSQGGVDMANDTGALTETAISAKIKNKAAKKPVGHVHTEREGSVDLSTSGLFPYKLSGSNTYFGEIEVMTGRPRLSTVRCEGMHGSTLVLHKQAFTDLKAQFPQFGALWQYAARRREWSRQRQLERLQTAHPLKEMARNILREELPRIFKSKKNHPSTTAVGEATLRQFQKDKFVTTTAAKIMDKKETIDSTHVELSQMRLQVDKLYSDVDGLREDIHTVLTRLGVQPVTELSVAV